jgi:hypothetical protein
MAALKANLDAVETEADDSGRSAKAQKAREHLKAKQKKRVRQEFNPNYLPFRTPDGKFRREKTASVLPPEPIRVAALDSLSGLSGNTTLGGSPTPADLSETVEIQLTPEIRALAQGLGTPVAIYEFVRNGFAFEPYAGSLKGSALTFKERGGNDWDLAAFLVALYRAAGIPARYVVGTVEIPVERAMSWLGVEDPGTAANLLASTGRKSQAVVSGGKIAAVRMERVWVRAYVAFNHHRGAKSGPGDTWVDVDPAFKLHEVVQTLKLATLPVFDQSAYLATLRTEGALDFYKGQFQAFLDANAPGHIPEAVTPLREIIPEQFGYLVGRLPHKVLSVAVAYTNAPDIVRQKFTLNILDTLGGPQLTYTATLTELLDKRLTLSYAPASATDAQTIAAYGGLYQTPPYLISLKPQLKLEGQIVAEGPAIGAAQEQTLEFQFITPLGTDTVHNTVTAGEYYAIALNAYAGSGSHQEVLDRSKRLAAIQETINLNDPATLDERLGELLYLTGRVFHHNISAANRKIAHLTQVVDIPEVSEMMYSLITQVSSVWGVPRAMTPAGIVGDMDRNTHLVMPTNGDASRRKLFMQIAGNESSYYEHFTTEKVFNAEAVSAVKALQIAADRGIPVHTINSGNIGTLLSTLQIQQSVKTAIQDAVDRGWQAIVPGNTLTLGDWTGIGYILENPETGEAYYPIPGGFNGALTLRSQEILDRVDNMTGAGFAAGSIEAAQKRNYRRCYPGADGIFNTADDACFTAYLEEEAAKFDRTCEQDVCAIRYKAHPDNWGGVTELFLINYEEDRTAFLTTHLQAQQWRSQDGAPYMRTGYTIIRAIREVMKHFKVRGHGIATEAGSGYRTLTRQIEQGHCARKPFNEQNCKRGHHLDGTAADIWLSDPEPGGRVPTKLELLCVADKFIGWGQVMDEGTNQTVHIAKPAINDHRDYSGIGRYTGKVFAWHCGPAPERFP